MEKLPNDTTDVSKLLTGKESAAIGRRIFMRYLGTTAAAGVALSACKNEMMDPATLRNSARAGYNLVDLGDLGGTDYGILNYAFALEQFEAAFYTTVLMHPYMGMTNAEKIIFKYIKDHEVAHRELFRTALGGGAIPDLTPDFSSINFSSRESVLKAAKAFEDLGVSAYNGVGQFIKSADYLTLAGKIVSVEARHAAVIARLIEPETALFASDMQIDANGLEMSKLPKDVLPIVAPLIKETINAMPVASRF